MSPQFVDFDADGQLDIVAGIFDGSPHLVRGSQAGWGKPEQILDREGQRIVLSAFWNFDTKKWDKTDRCNGKGYEAGEGHITSAVAFDVDGDGDLDLLLGDHRSGRVFVRRNEGSATKPSFATTNEILLADGKPIDVPGTVATLRLVDWNHDGRQDLACGGMGDSFSDGPGGGVVLFLNTGTDKAAAFGAPITLLEVSKKGQAEPTRPDSGLYMDFGDHDGDGDLDMVVGGYSHWSPKPVELTEAQKARVGELKTLIDGVNKRTHELMQTIEDAVKGLDEDAAAKKRDELWNAKQDAFGVISKERQTLQKELEPLQPGMKRESYVWLYENKGAKEASAGRK
jgi:hypothetical protein